MQPLQKSNLVKAKKLVTFSNYNHKLMSTTNHYTAIVQKIRSGDMTTLDEVFTDNRNAFISQLMKNYQIPLEEIKDIYAVAATIFYDNIMSGKLTTLTVKPLSYLLGIGQNLVKEWVRKQKNVPVDIEKILINHIAEETPVTDSYEQKLRLVISKLAELGKVCKEILELFYFERRSIPEITKRLGFANVDTAKSRKYKCNKRLKQLVNNQWQKISKYA